MFPANTSPPLRVGDGSSSVYEFLPDPQTYNTDYDGYPPGYNVIHRETNDGAQNYGREIRL